MSKDYCSHCGVSLGDSGPRLHRMCGDCKGHRDRANNDRRRPRHHAHEEGSLNFEDVERAWEDSLESIEPMEGYL